MKRRIPSAAAQPTFNLAGIMVQSLQYIRSRYNSGDPAPFHDRKVPDIELGNNLTGSDQRCGRFDGFNMFGHETGNGSRMEQTVQTRLFQISNGQYSDEFIVTIYHRDSTDIPFIHHSGHGIEGCVRKNREHIPGS